jgi:hypothetical protein
MLWWLIVGHAFADFVLQSEVMAKNKNRHNKGTPPPHQKYMPTWYYWLTAHALMHGGLVATITGRVEFGLAEFVCHWIIDFTKCEGKINVPTDQGLHIWCKLVWACWATIGW